MIKEFPAPVCSAVRNWSRAAADPAPEINQNEDIDRTFVNRNPRNLEQMAIAVKDRGWATVWPKREYYHRCAYVCVCTPVFCGVLWHVSVKVFKKRKERELPKVMAPLISQHYRECENESPVVSPATWKSHLIFSLLVKRFFYLI